MCIFFILDTDMICFYHSFRLEKSGIQQPAHTVQGKLEQARRWLEYPGMDDRYGLWLGLGVDIEESF